MTENKNREQGQNTNDSRRNPQDQHKQQPVTNQRDKDKGNTNRQGGPGGQK